MNKMSLSVLAVSMLSNLIVEGYTKDSAWNPEGEYCLL
jgi:hypothetical protein